MDSIVQPLNKKVKALSDRLNQVSTALRQGSPTAKAELNEFLLSIDNIKAEFKSVAATMNAGMTAAAGAIPNMAVLIKLVAFYLSELLAIFQLLDNLFKLFAGTLKLISTLVLFSADLKALQDSLNTKLIWLKRSLTRVKQKADKRIEWKKRELSAKSLLVYLRAYEQALIKAEADLVSKEPKTTSTNIQEFQTSLQKEESKNLKLALTSTRNKLKNTQLEIQEANSELTTYIPKDIKTWNDRWDAESAEDKKQLKELAETK